MEDEIKEPNTAWLFGLPGAGKSTIADAAAAILEQQGVKVARLDGDVLRTGLCADLGFSRIDRAENLRRASHLARFVSDIPCLVLASFITPVKADRELVKANLGKRGLMVWVKTDLIECEKRDPKGMYAKAKRGEIANFTGISSPFDEPNDADLILDTSAGTAEELARQLLERLGYRLQSQS